MSRAPGLGGRELLVNKAAHPAEAMAPPTRAPLDLHRRLPGYAVTPLVEVPELARANGVAGVWVKDESWRLELPAFKMLGASWAVYRAAAERLGHDPEPWSSLDELRTKIDPLRPLTLVAATDGNHGRAVARMAALLRVACDIYVPAGTAQARIDAIEGEGAKVAVVDGDYDAAVATAASAAGDRCLVIADVAIPGDEQVPSWVIEGYSTIFWEVDDQLAALETGGGEGPGRREGPGDGEAQGRGDGPGGGDGRTDPDRQRGGEGPGHTNRPGGGEGPDVVMVPVGVGALAAAAVRHYRREGLARRPRLIGVEPLAAACVLASLRAGRMVTVPGPHHSIMAGLNCGTPSLVAWPSLLRGLDAVVAVDDVRARQAMRDLAAAGIVAGETGAASLAGLTELAAGPGAEEVRRAFGVGPDAKVLLLCTEGATDPDAYRRIVAGD
jgi:diaminopropionate ammonia-lyase